MKRILLAITLFLTLIGAANAQSTTTVTSTVKDPNGVAYAFGTYGITFTNPTTQQALYGGVPLQPSQMLYTGQLDINGALSISLPSNAVITPSGTQWTFKICANASQIAMVYPPPTLPCFSSAQTISGSSQVITFTAATIPVAAGGGITSVASIPGEPGLTAVPVTSGLMAEYRILATETPSGLLDYSGNARNATGTVGTAPTIIAVTGGIQCNANGAVILPTAINAALDIFVYVGSQTNSPAGTNAFNAPIAGNGGGGTPSTISALLLTDTIGNYQAGQTYVSQVLSATGAAGIGGSGIQSFNGNGLIEWAMPGTADRYFINGLEVTYHGTPPSSAGVNTSGPFQICGAAAGSGFSSSTYFNGQVYYVAAYNRVVNAAERASVSTYIQNAMTLRGVPPVQQLTSIITDTVTFVGDSMVRSSSALLHPFSSTVTLTNVPNVVNYANDSLTNASWAAAAPSASQFFQKGASRNAVVIMEGTNDVCGVSIPLATSLANMSSAIRGFKATTGQRVILSTIPDCAGGLGSAGKNALNAGYRQLWRSWGADALCDVAADPNIGADGANANTTFFTDTVHYTAHSNYNEHGRIAQMCINRLFGNTDFSTATTYSIAATAAVATTAGSETGNTITLTSAATPANCPVGATVRVAGTTPAAYSGVFKVITSTATQITYWVNTTALGVITVQGTLVCPQSQDADQYAILNFTGNHTLDSCQGWTGQNIYRRNINAGAVTLVPDGTETITGAGATPTTLAANTTAILQSQLVSASAAGCNWVRVQ